MDRKEAIEVVESEISYWEGTIDEEKHGGNVSDVAENELEGIKVLLSTAKLVEKAVGKVREEIDRLEKMDPNILKDARFSRRINNRLDDPQGYGGAELLTLRWICDLLTEGE